MRDEPASLRRCLRDPKGRPVPFINIWSGELPEERWTIKADLAVGRRPAVFSPWAPGTGTPDFTRQNPQRQRRCMARRQCQVCAARIPEGQGLLVLSSISTATVEIEGRPRSVVSEPWLCPPCVDFARRVCPGLLHRGRVGDLLLVRPTRYELVVSYGWVEGPLEEYSRRVQPAMWVKAAVLDAGELGTLPAA